MLPKSGSLILMIVIILLLSLTNVLDALDSFRVLSEGSDYTEIEFNLSGYELMDVEVDGEKYQRLYHPNSGFVLEEGLPELLTFSTILSIPSTGTVELLNPLITDSEQLTGINLFPSQGADLDINEETGFLKDRQFYVKDVDYSLELAQVTPPAIMRDVRMVSLTISPFSYNPQRQELEVVNSLVLRVNYNRDEPGENELMPNPRGISRSFERIYEGAVLNYPQFRDPDAVYQPRSLLVIYHHSPTIVPTVNQYVSWKRDKGFEVTAINTSTMSTNSAIKSYIQNAYNTWDVPPEYVVLIGAGTGTLAIPYWSNSDHPYALLEGNDDHADVFVGRIWATDSTQLATVWNKIRNYEREPYLGDTSWYQHHLLVGDPGTSGVSTIFTAKYVKEIMLRHNNNATFAEVYNSPFSSQIDNAINQGVALYSYRGYIGMSGWSPNSASLYNGLKLPNGLFITCSTLSYSYTGSKTSDFFTMGTPTTAKGGISAIGMTTSSTKTAYNNCLTGGIAYGIIVENIRTMGEALVRGKLNLWQNYGIVHPTHPPQFSQWANLIGDPSVDIWIEEPKELNASYEQVLAPGSNSLAVTVTDAEGLAIEDAWVTVRQGDDDVFATGYSDQNGNVTLFFSPDSEGEVKVTITKPDYIPHLGEFDITGVPAVSYHDSVLNSDPLAGSTVNFDISVKNHQTQTVSGANGTISTNSDFIDILSESSSFGTIAPNSVVSGISSFAFEIQPETPSGHIAVFDLTIVDSSDNSWISRFSIIVQNGNLQPQEIIVNDGGNGVLDPAEQAQIVVPLHNAGQADLSAVSAVLRGGGQGLSIVDSTAYYGNINAGQTVSSSGDHFIVSAASYVIPGSYFDLELELSTPQGFIQTRMVRLTIGDVSIEDPLGPDAYGYWVYDIGDVNYLDAPNYDWIEIVPSLGGSGVNTGLQANFDDVQQVMNMDLPFTFSFYGLDYDVISISANGWASFGVTEQSTQRNWRLPGPLGPSSIIAAFWDNLSLGAGGVYTYYDQVQNIFIIQWQNAQNVINNAQETFQIILYDPMYYFTATGDGPIKIQYKVFNNVNNGANTPYGIGNWGNYATVGIADHTCTVGLEYTFANEYPTAAMALADETALYFTTGSVDFSGPFVAVESYTVDDGNNNIPEYGETININMTLINLGAVDVGSVTAVVSSTDPYVTVTEDTAFFGDIDSENTSTVNAAYTIDIADNVPHLHRVFFSLAIAGSDNNSWTHNFYMDVNAPELITLEPIIYDALPGGNNNGLIDPGEDLIMYLPLNNTGGSASQPITLSVVSTNPLVVINSISAIDFGNLAVGESYYSAIDLSIDDNVSMGMPLAFDYTMTTNSYTFEGQVSVSVGGMVEVQLGTGTATNASTGGNPINIYYRSLRGQTVYTAAELNAAGVNGGAITEFGYYVTSSPIHALPNFVIRMKHTTAVNASSHDNGPFTTVYQNTSYMPASGGWDMLTLDTPFVWNGVDNLLVDTAFSQVPNWNSSGQQRIYSTTNGYRYVRSDGSDQTNATTTTTTPDKPQAYIVIGSSSDDNVIRPENLTAELSGLNVHLEWDVPLETRVSSNRNTAEHLAKTRRLQDRDSADDVTRDPLGYNVYRNGVMINNEMVLSTEYFDSDLVSDLTYYYYITAVYPEGESMPSNVATIEYAGRVVTPVLDPEPGYYNTAQSIEITTDTANAVIYYTIDGSEPTEDDVLYTVPINLGLGDNVVINAKGFSDDLLPSETAGGEYIINQTVPNPSIDPGSGVYQDEVEVVISLPDDMWTVYYTVDGTEPTEQSTIYSESFTLEVSTTVKAKAFAVGWLPSETVVTDFVILNAPTELTAESYEDVVYLQWEHTGIDDLHSSFVDRVGQIRETNSSRPDITTRNGSLRNSRVIRQELTGFEIYRSIDNPDNMELLAVSDGIVSSFDDEDLSPGVYYYKVKAVYTEGISNYSNESSASIYRVEEVVVNHDSGVYHEVLSLVLSTNTPDASVYYTLDGSNPTTESILYSEPIMINYHTEIRARAFKTTWIPSEILTSQYYILYAPSNLSAEGEAGAVYLSWEEPWSPQRNTNIANNNTRSVRNQRSVRDARTLLGYNVYRSVDDVDYEQVNVSPVEDTEYLDSGLTFGSYYFYVTALYSHGESLPTESVTATVLNVVANPVFTPDPGFYEEQIIVEISSETDLAEIYYTLDGTDPDQTSLLYTESILLEETTTIKAIATLDGWEDSEVVTVEYEIETTSVGSDNLPILTTELLNAYPNPFNPQTTISFALSQPDWVGVDIYDVSGRKIKPE
jgi:hypothetical protein